MAAKIIESLEKRKTLAFGLVFSFILKISLTKIGPDFSKLNKLPPNFELRFTKPTLALISTKVKRPVSEFNKFEPRLKSVKNRFQFGLRRSNFKIGMSYSQRYLGNLYLEDIVVFLFFKVKSRIFKEKT